jgi:hypothetical protein
VNQPVERRFRPELGALAILVVASTILLIALESRITFIWDDWEFLLYRRGGGAAAFLDPHNQHIVAGPVAIYKLLLAGFGMDSARPFQLVSNLFLAISGVLLFVYTRRRVGAPLALMGTALILFFGAAWQDLLWAFQMGLSGSVAAGLGALLALDRDDRKGDLIAVALLSVSTLFTEVGIAFTAGALVDLALRERPWKPRLYVVAAPLLLYALWWAGWGHQAHTSFSLRNVGSSPGYVLDAASQAIAALLGLAGTRDPNSLVGIEWGRAILALIAALAVVRFRRFGGPSRGFWVALAVGLAFWFLTAFNANVLRLPTTHRLLYPSGVLVILIAAELLRGVKLSPRVLIAATAVTVCAVGSNLVAFSDGYNFFRLVSAGEKADLAALEIADRPSFTLNTDAASGWIFPASTPSYQSAVEAFGSPANTEAEVLTDSESQREETDRVLAEALELRLTPAVGSPAEPASSGAAADGVSCRTARASPAAQTGILLAAGRVTILDQAGTRPNVLLVRYADEFAVDLGPLPGERAELGIPRDRSDRPWRLGLRGDGPVTICLEDA